MTDGTEPLPLDLGTATRLFPRGKLKISPGASPGVGKTFSDASYLYLPLKVGNNSLGVVGIWPLKGSLTLDGFQIAQNLLDQAAFAIDRLSNVNA